jgi:integrase
MGLKPMKCDLPYVNSFRDRHGHERFYFRRKGFPRVTLPPPDDPGFLEAYRAAKGEAATNLNHIRPITAGLFGALCQEYMQSADFVQLAESTRREMKYVINALIAEHGDKRLAKLERRHILGWKDKLAHKPGAANKMLRTVKQLMTFAEARGHRPDNLAKGIKMMRGGRWRAWTDAELVAFEERWPLGSRERTGFALALYTAQRRTDLVRLKWADIAGGVLRVKQNKTKVDQVIPIHPELKTALAAVQPRHPKAIIATEKGEPLSPVYFGHQMADAIEKAGLPQGCILHGLRKTAGRLLAEAGAQVAPITGHLTERMTAEYSRDADQAKLARASVLKWGKVGKRNKRGK